MPSASPNQAISILPPLIVKRHGLAMKTGIGDYWRQRGRTRVLQNIIERLSAEKVSAPRKAVFKSIA